jgi:monoamine oxidase
VTSDGELSPLIGTSATARKRLELCVRQIEIWMGATAEELQIDDFGDVDLIGDDPGPHCIVPSGMERFIDGLAKPVTDCIRTNTRVTSINYVDKNKVVVKTSNGETLEAEYVVVTSSLGYLKSKQLTFEPELPSEKTAAIGRSKMGQYMKVLLQFPSVFWPEDAVFFGQITDNSVTSSGDEGEKRVYFPAIFNYYFAKNAPVLEAQLVGTKAEHLSETMTDAEIVRAMYLQLQETFGADIPVPVGHLITR